MGKVNPLSIYEILCPLSASQDPDRPASSSSTPPTLAATAVSTWQAISAKSMGSVCSYGVPAPMVLLALGIIGSFLPFLPTVELSPEMVLFGTGPTLRFPHPGLTRSLIEAGIGIEVMDTGAACRTYNILSAEERRVAAALLV